MHPPPPSGSLVSENAPKLWLPFCVAFATALPISLGSRAIYTESRAWIHCFPPRGNKGQTWREMMALKSVHVRFFLIVKLGVWTDLLRRRRRSTFQWRKRGFGELRSCCPHPLLENQLLGQRRTKSTRKRNTPENADNRLFRESAFSGVVRFGCSLFSSKRAPKHTQKPNTPENARVWEQSITCVFGCVAFSGVLWHLPIIGWSSLSLFLGHRHSWMCWVLGFRSFDVPRCNTLHHLNCQEFIWCSVFWCCSFGTLLFQGFLGFGKDKKRILVSWGVLPCFLAQKRKGRTGECAQIERFFAIAIANCLCFFFFFSSVRNDLQNTHKQTLSPTQSRDNSPNLFVCVWFFIPWQAFWTCMIPRARTCLHFHFPNLTLNVTSIMVPLGLMHIHDAGIGDVLLCLCKLKNINCRGPKWCNPLHH